MEQWDRIWFCIQAHYETFFTDYRCHLFETDSVIVWVGHFETVEYILGHSRNFLMVVRSTKTTSRVAPIFPKMHSKGGPASNFLSFQVTEGFFSESFFFFWVHI